MCVCVRVRVCMCACACVYSQGNNRTLLSWLKLWDDVVFGKPSVSNKGPMGHNNKAPGYQPKLKNGKKPFLNRFEYQDPKTFNNPDVSAILHDLDCAGKPVY